MKKKYWGYVLAAPLVLGCAVFYAASFFLVFRYSLMRGVGYSQKFVGLDNFRRMLQNEAFRLSFGNTLKFLAIGLPLIMVLSYLIALLLKNQAGKHKLLKSVFLFPYIMPVAGTVLLVDLLFSGSGAVNSLLLALGLPVRDWLSGPEAFWVVMLLYLWKNAGYTVILLLAGLVTIPGEQYESAGLDGASGLQKFFWITTPQMWPSVFFAAAFSLINAFKCFREIFLIGGEHPHDSIYMLQHFLNNGFQKLHFDRLSVASILLLLVILIFLGTFYGYVGRKERYRK